MCFQADVRPPELPSDLVLPVAAGGTGAEITMLEASDGSELAAGSLPSTDRRRE
jgi:hypothetical protein